MSHRIQGQERAFLRALFDAAVDAAAPARVVPPHLPRPPQHRLIALGAGKASAAMARAVEDTWAGPLSGLVVTRHGHGIACNRIEVVEAAHPLPDAVGVAAARRMVAMAADAGPDDLVLVLISGGGSSLLTLPAQGLTLAEVLDVSRSLLRSGADIASINTVRKHLSAIAGGRLALAAHPAEVLALVISDVPGDDPTTVASGPTLPDPTTLGDARAVLSRWRIVVPSAVAQHLGDSRHETPKPGDSRLARSRAVVVASSRLSLSAASQRAQEDGVAPHILGEIVGEAREAGRQMAATALATQQLRRPGDPPVVLLSGGETTVTVKGTGRGGRNGEFLAGLALALAGAAGIYAIAADTDGIDGTEDNAGAFVAPDTLARAAGRGLDLAGRLAENDTYPAFAALDDLVVTGPTRTNVNDFRAVLVL